MSAATLFARLQGAVSNGDDTSPETSTVFYNPVISAYHNVVYYRRETVSFAAVDDPARDLTFPGLTTGQWVCVIARVIGRAQIVTEGTDWNGITSFESRNQGYGTDRSPGMIAFTTTKLTAIQIEPLAADTTVEYLACILVDDSSL